MSDQQTVTEVNETVSEAKEDVAEAKEDVVEVEKEAQQQIDAAQEEVAETEQEALQQIDAAEEEVAEAKDELAKEQRQHQEAIEQKMPTVERTANSIIGKEIKNSDGDTVGKIADIGIDWQNEKAAFIVVSTGGLLGVGDELYKVPLQRLSTTPDSDYFTMDTIEKDLTAEFSKFEPVE